MSVIEIKDLTFAYRKNEYVIKGINLTINRGEYICILGHNGSGKSTLAKLIVGLLFPSSGEIYIDGELFNSQSIDRLRQKIGIVFQNPDNQFVGVTVQDDIAFGLENRCFPREEMLQRIDYYSKLVSMDSFLDHNPENLSGGEKQRVAIAGVLAMDPEVIIFDEATSMLDPKGVFEVNEVINKLKGTKTIITITHNLIEGINADRILVMKDGQIVLDGTPQKVFKQKEVLRNSNLDILEVMKISEFIEQDYQINRKEELEDVLWELTFKK